MKTIQTLSTIVAAMLLLIATEKATAQSYDTSTEVDVVADVVSSLSLNQQEGTLNFGLIGQDLNSSPASIDPTDGTPANIIDTDGVTIAKYVLSGTEGQDIAVTYNTATLSNDGASTDEITFTADISALLGEDTDNASGGDIAVSAGSPITLTSVSDITFWVAGELSSDDDAVDPGSYSGTFEISVDYVNN